MGKIDKKCLLFKVNSCDGPLVQLIIVVGVFILIPDVIIVIVLIFLFSLSMEIFQKKTLIKKVFRLAYISIILNFRQAHKALLLRAERN